VSFTGLEFIPHVANAGNPPQIRADNSAQETVTG
jgi:hypothetical protein